MKFIRKYIIIIAIVLPVAALVILRLIGWNHFKIDAGKWANPSLSMSNVISEKQSMTLNGDILIITLDEENREYSDQHFTLLNIPPDSILNKKNIRMILHYNGTVLLKSANTSLSARIWMVLSQMGCTNIYILSNEDDNEVLKYKFRPDTLVSPEF